ncbi:helix-turn-helix domain-containing protein [Halomicroarcula sp. S1AR25-4]|uniref:histidine kinase N-terminal 7TM domain-containing protein n=1 Tax=Haloarcula sp. S1AR25-4 TaxID=2950538 RepID=UPI0028748F03|nr:histidine kinase N-terminal 7TM domain-containing protein [Halomicroarcula sp. S1AR25-4]MDS0279169.1 helix-turn-helix domain-containing protein [Halomicroarcula sp. S1AR25-4]
MTLATVAHVLLLALSVLTTTALTGYAWRNRAEHGARAFSGLVAAFTLYAGAHLVGLLTADLGARLLWEYVQWTGTAAIPVLWMLFALEYTGHDELIDRRTVAALSVVPVVTAALAWTNPWHHLMWTDNTLVVVSGLAIFDQSFGPWFWVFTVFTYVLITTGGFLLLRLVWFSDHLYADQAILLVVGVTVPILASALSVLPVVQVGRPLLDLTPYSFVVSGFAFGYALFRHRLFDLVPATRQLGRSAVIHHLEDGVVIVDTTRRVLYLNPTAADLFDCSSSAALGQPVRSLVDESAIDFDTEDALAELGLDGNVYEIRTSPIHDRHGRLTGHTLVIQDITTRKNRERRLETQREELERLDSLNAAIRGVHRALVTATSRSEIRRAVCERLTEDGIYRTACAADLSTLQGEGAGWTIAGADADPSALPADIASAVPAESRAAATPVVVDPDDQRGTWTVVPLVYGPTVYGVLALRSAESSDGDSTAIPDREREVLAELGELIGHASNAVETRRLLSAESVVELEFASRDTDGTLLELAAETECSLELTGIVPNAVDGHLAYLRVASGEVPDEDALTATHSDRIRTIREDEGGLVEWAVPDGTLVGTLVDSGAQVVSVTVEDRVTTAVAEVAPDADVRSLVEEVKAAFPETRLVSKRTRDRPVGRPDGISRGTVGELTDRQQEVLETAYRAGYFDWPRGSTAEEVASTLDISAPTLHGHLRKAEARLLTDLFDGDRRADD